MTLPSVHRPTGNDPELRSSLGGRIDNTTYLQAQRVVASRSSGRTDCGNLLAMLGLLGAPSGSGLRQPELRY